MNAMAWEKCGAQSASEKEDTKVGKDGGIARRAMAPEKSLARLAAAAGGWADEDHSYRAASAVPATHKTTPSSCNSIGI